MGSDIFDDKGMSARVDARRQTRFPGCGIIDPEA
jgi:hypothetical protein